jgi:hypothetical protein
MIHMQFVLSAWALQVQENPPASGFDATSTLGMYRLSDDERLKMPAITFMRFAVTNQPLGSGKRLTSNFCAGVQSPADCH